MISLAISAGALAADAGRPLALPPLVDHHMHMFSPDSSAVLDSICQALGPTGCPPQVSHASSTAADIIQALDAAGIKQGVLLSNAYFFDSPDLAVPVADSAGKVRAENTFIIAQARESAGRLIPFISVNPRASGAVEEVNYWARKGGAVGLKLHLASANFNFRDPQQVAQLAAVFEAAGKGHLAIVIHMQTRVKDYGAEDAQIFLKQVFPRAGTVPVQIAHSAGGGGIDAGQLAALGIFAKAMHSDPKATRHLYFDLAMVPDLFSNEAKISAKPDDVAALKRLMHQIGLHRFLLASDYTHGLDLVAYFANERASLAVSTPEWVELTKNVAPYVTATHPAK
jgi:predicted TIM-barrel fold metal-dependent hydrolase